MNEDNVIVFCFVVLPIIMSIIFVIKAKSTKARVLTLLFILLTIVSCSFVAYIFALGNMRY